MIGIRSTLTWTRQAEVEIDLDGLGKALGRVHTPIPGREWVCLVVGSVRKGESVTDHDVLCGAARLLEHVAEHDDAWRKGTT